MGTEIERRFLLNTEPHGIALGQGAHLRQGYLAGEDDVEVRLRIVDTTATLTVKAGRGLSRTEVEVALGQAEAEQLWPHTLGRRIDKVRYKVPLERWTAEVDCYFSDLDGLWSVEVEFSDLADAEAFIVPSWFGREVTGDRSWTNAELARHGRPDRAV